MHVPRLATLPDDRLSLRASLLVSSPLLRQAYHGSLAISGRLQVDASRHAVMLAEARLDSLAIEGVDERTQRQVATAAGLLADRLARDMPIYSYKPEELRRAGVQFVPTAIRTSSSGISIHLEPLRDGRL